jgi:hypothetical protein
MAGSTVILASGEIPVSEHTSGPTAGLVIAAWGLVALAIVAVSIYSWRRKTGPNYPSRRLRMFQIWVSALATIGTAVVCFLSATLNAVQAGLNQDISGIGSHAGPTSLASRNVLFLALVVAVLVVQVALVWRTSVGARWWSAIVSQTGVLLVFGITSSQAVGGTWMCSEQGSGPSTCGTYGSGILLNQWVYVCALAGLIVGVIWWMCCRGSSGVSATEATEDLTGSAVSQ